MRTEMNPQTRWRPHRKVEMECVDEVKREYLCELCLHEERDEDGGQTPEFFKSRAALKKWNRKRRKSAKIAAKAFKAASRRARHRRRK